MEINRYTDLVAADARLTLVRKPRNLVIRQPFFCFFFVLIFIRYPRLYTQEESRANVVINQKMMKVIVSGIPQSVRLGVAMIEDVITFGRSAEHAGGMGGHPPNFLDFPGAVAFGGDLLIISFTSFYRYIFLSKSKKYIWLPTTINN